MPNLQSKAGIAVIGCGHWGPNHIRIFNDHDRSEVLACADLKPAHLERIRARFPLIRATSDYHDWLTDTNIHAVVIATPTHTHAQIARDVLRAGKHVLVEKPLCMNSAEALELAALAATVDRVLMVGHVFLYNNGIIRLRDMIASGKLGRIQYLDAVRTNLGPVRGDVNALYDLGTHDITIFNYLMDAVPVSVSAHGRCILQPAIEDVCFVTLQYPDGTLGHLHVSWLNPRKIRTLTVVGERRMAHWDDVDPVETLRLYDKGLDEPPYYDSFGEFQYLLRNADVHVPAIRQTEPLLNQADEFLRRLDGGTQIGSGAREGWIVAKILEAAMLSMKRGAASCPIEIDEPVVGKTVSRDAKTIEYSPSAGRPAVIGLSTHA